VGNGLSLFTAVQMVSWGVSAIAEKSADRWRPRRVGALSREIGENSALAPTDILATLGERGIFLRKSANETSVARKKRQWLSLENPRKLPTLGAEVNSWRNKSARGFSCLPFVPRKFVRNGAETWSFARQASVTLRLRWCDDLPLPPAIFSLSTNPGGLSARMVTEGSPSLFAHAAQ
jgi:hypothetical protein